MAEQLEACAPIEEPNWNAGSVHALVEPALVELLNRYEATEDGTAFFTPTGTLISVKDAMEWHVQWEIQDNAFKHWCRQQALVEDEDGALERYFGPTAELLNFTDHRVSWPKWFKAEIDARDKGAPPLTELFTRQISFEHSIGYDFVGSPYLFPTRAEVLKILEEDLQGASENLKEKERNDFEKQPRKAGEEEKRGKHARKQTKRIEDLAEAVILMGDAYNELEQLKLLWRGYAGSVTICNALVEDAATRYIRGEYDSVAVFKAHRSRVEKWADESASMRIDPNLPNTPGHKMAVTRFALATMVSCEKLIEDEIDKYTKSAGSVSQRMDKARLNKLRSGTIYRP